MLPRDAAAISLRTTRKSSLPPLHCSPHLEKASVQQQRHITITNKEIKKKKKAAFFLRGDQMTLDGETYLSKINPEMFVKGMKSFGEKKKMLGSLKTGDHEGKLMK